MAGSGIAPAMAAGGAGGTAPLLWPHTQHTRTCLPLLLSLSRSERPGPARPPFPPRWEHPGRRSCSPAPPPTLPPPPGAGRRGMKSLPCGRPEASSGLLRLRTGRPMWAPSSAAAAARSGMEAQGSRRQQLPVLLLWVNGLMTLGFAGVRQQTELCNESLMLEKLPACGKYFEEMMKKVDSKKWCNLTEFIMYYDNFTQCTEREANNASCFWPNPLAEGFITGIHKQFFSNCTSEKIHWEDPPDEIVVALILIPVMLTCAMITLVVWCSKRSDILV
nr:receptor activity-modifying protein 3 isoform X1 [Taeniopygia guttata]